MVVSDIKGIRLSLLLTQQEFATAISVNIRTVQKWEKGDIVELRFSTIRKINKLVKESKKRIL